MIVAIWGWCLFFHEALQIVLAFWACFGIQPIRLTGWGGLGLVGSPGGLEESIFIQVYL